MPMSAVSKDPPVTRSRLPGWLSRIPARVMWAASRPYIICFALTALIVSRWFDAGTFIASGDMGPFIRSGWAPEASWTWNHSTTGAGSAAYNVGRGFEFILIDAVKALGGNEYIAQWLFYICIYGFVSVSVAYCVRFFVRNEFAVILGGMFAVLNGFFLTRLPNPLNIISVATIALLTGLALRVAAGRPISPVWGGFALLPISFLAFNPPMMLVAFAWAVGGTSLVVLLVLGRSALWRLLKWFIPLAPWAILLNAWWLVPVAWSFLGGGGAATNASFQDPSNWAWSQAQNQIPNILTLVANWAWVKPQYLPFAASMDEPWIIWVRYLIPALVFAAPLLARLALRRSALALLAVSLPFVFLAKGLQPVWAPINLWMYNNVPMFWLFREPMSKLGQVLVIFFAILIAMSVEGVWARAKKVRLRSAKVLAVAVTAAAVAVMAYVYPLYTGSVIPDARPQLPSAHVRVPDYWWQTTAKINQSEKSGKLLVLPLDDYYQMPTIWGFAGVDSIANLLSTVPVIQPKPDGYFGDVPGFSANVRAIETALLSGDTDAVPKLLNSVGASRVLIRHDLVKGLPGRTFADDAILTAGMKQTPNMTQVQSGTLDLWELGDGNLPDVRTYDRILAAPWQPAAGASALGTMSTDRAILAAATPKGAVPDPTDPKPAVADDVISWPAPAVAKGEPTTEVALTGGTYTLGQRARAAAVLVPKMDGSNKLLLKDPTKVTIDGKPESARPDLKVAVPQPLVAVQTSGRAVSLDGWLQKRAPGNGLAGGSAPSVVVGSGATLTGYSLSKTPAKPSPWSKVYDCNNYEPRPWNELGLQFTQPGGDLQLSAQDHAACTRTTLADAKPGRTYRIRFESRSVDGKAPEVCLWQIGLDGCLPTPRLNSSKEWSPFEQIVTMNKNSKGLQVIFYANVGARLIPPTTTRYRDVKIEALDNVVSKPISPPKVPDREVTLPAGNHTLGITGGPSGSVFTDFGPVEDCYNTGQYTIDQAGITATKLPDQPQPAFQLTAKHDRACISADAPQLGTSSLYQFSFQGRSVALRNPAFCILYKGPETCAKLPPSGPWPPGDWVPYSQPLTPNPSAIESRIYLYGSRDLQGQQEAIVQYRDVQLIPVSSPSTVVLVKKEALAPPANLTYKGLGPAQYKIDVTGATPGDGGTAVPANPATGIGLAETYAPGWAFQGETGTPHVALQGWMNGWIPKNADVSGTLTYSPAMTARKLLYVFPLAVVAAIVWLALPWPRRRRRRKSQEWRERHHEKLAARLERRAKYRSARPKEGS